MSFPQVDSSYGSDAFEIMAMVDKAMYLFIKYSDDIFISETPRELMNKYSLEDYMYMRSWTGGTIPLAGYFWFGVDAPKVRASWGTRRFHVTRLTFVATSWSVYLTEHGMQGK